MLQLVYHAPPQIAKQALKLLKAIRSPEIIPELKAMFLDTEYDMKHRREIYEIICVTRGNFDFSEFAPVIPKVFSLFLFSYSFDLLKHHPINVSWILRDIEAKYPYPPLYIFSKLFNYVPEIASERILKILSENEIGFDKDIGFQLYKYGGEPFKIWLDKNWERIIYSWLLDDLGKGVERYWQRLRESIYLNEWLNKWPELKQSLSELKPEWVLKRIQGENIIRQKLIYIRLLPYASKTASDLLLKLIDEKQIFLDLETAGLLHQYGDETVQNWLVERWDELIYLCLIDNVGVVHHLEEVRIINILEKWPELKNALFQHAPNMVEEYTQLKLQYKHYDDCFGLISDNNIREHPIWQEIENRHNEWLQPNKHMSGISKDLYNRDYLTVNSEADIPQIAVKTYVLGTAIDVDSDASGWLSYLLLESNDQWRHEWVSEIDGEYLIFAYTPVRFEAGYALRNFHRPHIWTNLIQSFLVPKDMFGALTDRMIERHMLCWISRMTDMLSGVEPERPDEEIPLNARPWFCALVNQIPSEIVTQSEA